MIHSGNQIVPYSDGFIHRIFNAVIKNNIWKSRCPECKSEEAVYLYDRGIKLFWRSLFANNRFVCAKCNVTWRRRTRYTYNEIAECARRHETHHNKQDIYYKKPVYRSQ